MSTRSRIGLMLPNKTITSIYCHSDGYLDWNGIRLYEHYKTAEKVRDLIALGDISSLHEEVAPAAGVEHSYDGPRAKGVTVAYRRDRGEANVEPRIGDNLQTFLDHGEEYAYLFNAGEWTVWNHSTKPFDGMSLISALVHEKLMAEPVGA